MKPPTFCGLLYDIFECCPDLAKQGDAGAGQIPVILFLCFTAAELDTKHSPPPLSLSPLSILT